VRFEYIKKSAKASGPALVGIETAEAENFTTLVTSFEEH
jgi:hypothetical protein